MATINAVAGQPFTTYLEGGPESLDWQVRVYDTTDAVVVGPAADDFDTLTADITSTQVNPEQVLYEVELTAPIPAVSYEPGEDGTYVYTVAWMSAALGDESEPDVLLVTLGAAFASLRDLVVRLGYVSVSDLTALQRAQGVLLLSLATGIIADEVGKDAAWAAALNPVPATLRGVCLEMVARVMQNPGGVRSESETLGQYQHSASYTDGAHGLAFDDAWSMMCRRLVYGRLSGSSTPATTLHRVIEYAETGDITA